MGYFSGPFPNAMNPTAVNLASTSAIALAVTMVSDKEVD